MGTESEPRSLRIEPYGERMGTEWGLGPFTIEQTTEDVTAIHCLARAGSEGDGYLATGRRLGNRAAICGKAGATVRDASRTSDQDGPEPGHLRRRRARSKRRPEERSDGERTGPERRRVRGKCARKSCAGWQKASSPAT
jgi:hypothetical protein